LKKFAERETCRRRYAEIRCGRLGITACRNTATNEEVKIAIAVHVGQSEWTGGRELTDER
jgi:hypothetical protein